MLQNARVIPFTVFELLRENQRGGEGGGKIIPPTQIRIKAGSYAKKKKRKTNLNQGTKKSFCKGIGRFRKSPQLFCKFLYLKYKSTYPEIEMTIGNWTIKDRQFAYVAYVRTPELQARTRNCFHVYMVTCALFFSSIL